jgi:hypothetical protein
VTIEGDVGIAVPCLSHFSTGLARSCHLDDISSLRPQEATRPPRDVSHGPCALPPILVLGRIPRWGLFDDM